MSRPRRLAQLSLALFTAALLLSACGGSEDESRHSPQSPPSTAGSVDPGAEPAKDVTAATPKPHASSKGGGAPSKEDGGTKPNSAPAKQTTTGTEPAASGNRGHERSPAAKQVKIEGCPAGMSKRKCSEVGKAYEQQKGGSTAVETSECPPAMSQSDCQSVGKAYEEAQAGGKTVAPSECPSAMTEAQCLEAGRAYEEATK